MTGPENETVWTWRQAVLQADLASTTKLVLLVLSTHMNDHGESCYPSITVTAQEASLSRQSVMSHLDLAREAGWIIIGRHGFAGQKWKAHDYKAAWPRANRDSEVPNPRPEGRQRRSPPGSKGGQRGSPPRPEDGTGGSPPCPEGGQPERSKAVKDVDPNSPKNSPGKYISDLDLRGFRDAYPASPHWSDPRVREALGKALATGADFDHLLAAASAYKSYCAANDWHNPCSPVRWLIEERWPNVEPPPDQEASRAPAPAKLTQPRLEPDKAAWWEGMRERVLKAKGEAWFKSWFAQLVYDGTTIWAPSALVRDWVSASTNVPPEIEAALKTVPIEVGQPPSVQTEAES